MALMERQVAEAAVQGKAKRWYIAASHGISETFSRTLVASFQGEEVSPVAFTEPMIVTSITDTPLLEARAVLRIVVAGREERRRIPRERAAGDVVGQKIRGTVRGHLPVAGERAQHVGPLEG